MRTYIDWSAVIVSLVGFTWVLTIVLRQKADPASNSLELRKHTQRQAGLFMFGGMFLSRFPDVAPFAAGWANEVLEAAGLVLTLIGVWRLMNTSAQSDAV